MAVLTNITGSPNLYSTGTWTITLGDGFNLFTPSFNTGYYTRIGNMYFCSLYYTWTSTGGASDIIRISLPAAASSTIPRNAPCLGACTGISFSHQLACVLSITSNYFNIADLSLVGSAPTFLTNTSYAASGTLIATAIFSV